MKQPLDLERRIVHGAHRRNFGPRSLGRAHYVVALKIIGAAHQNTTLMMWWQFKLFQNFEPFFAAILLGSLFE